MPNHTLQIKHVAATPDLFQAVRLEDGKSAPAAAISPPGAGLLSDLRWYLEQSLDHPDPARAQQTLDALRGWGSAAFEALFGHRGGGRFFEDATRQGLADLDLQIWSDDPEVLAWPWEALRDSETGALALTCQMERRLSRHIRDPGPLPASLQRDQVRVLHLATGLRLDLDALFAQHDLPAQVDVLRPPTFAQLREHLRRHHGRYHIVHFDGHGDYQGQGALVFPREDGAPERIDAELLSTLLRECAVPAMVLHSGRSAMLDRRARDPFASVAAALLQAGVRSVVSMAYALHAGAGPLFLTALYRRLFETGRFAEAVRAGRQELFARQGRPIGTGGEAPLEDWLVPVLYQQDPLDFSFARELRRAAPPPAAEDPPPPARVTAFLSLSHDSPAHEQRVLALARRLVQDGIDVELDLWVGSPAEGWPQWMERQLARVDFVLVVCTETYHQRASGLAPAGQGRGVRWEALLTYQHLYEADSVNRRFLPVVFSQADLPHVPAPLRAVAVYDMSTDAGYEKLYRRLTGQPEHVKPAPGPIRRLPSK